MRWRDRLFLDSILHHPLVKYLYVSSKVSSHGKVNPVLRPSPSPLSEGNLLVWTIPSLEDGRERGVILLGSLSGKFWLI